MTAYNRLGALNLPAAFLDGTTLKPRHLGDYDCVMHHVMKPNAAPHRLAARAIDRALKLRLMT